MPKTPIKNAEKGRKSDIADIFGSKEIQINEDDLLKELSGILGEEASTKSKEKKESKPKASKNINLLDLDKIVANIDNLDINNDDEEIEPEFETELNELLSEDIEETTNLEMTSEIIEKESCDNPVPLTVVNEVRQTAACSIERSIENTENVEQLKKLAVEAKRNGNLDLAKQYLLKYQKINSDNNLSGVKISSAEVTFDNSKNTSNLNASIASTNIDYGDQFTKLLEFYQNSIEKATEEGNSSKIRRMKRIYDEIKLAHSKFLKKIPYPYNELAIPPSFPQFPKDMFKPLPIKTEKTQKEETVNFTPTKILQEEIHQNIEKSINDSQSSVVSEPIDELSKLKKQAFDAKRAGDIETAKALMLKIKSLQPKAIYQSITPDKPKESRIEPKPKEYTPISSLESAQKCLLSQNQLIKSKVNELKISGVSHLSDHYGALLKFSSLESEHLNLTKENSKNPPKVIIESRYIPFVSQNLKIDDKQCQIKINNVKNIKYPHGYANKDYYMCMGINFGIPKESPQIFETASVKGSSDATFNQSFNFTINRTDRNLYKQIQRYSVIFTLKLPGSLFKKEEILGIGSLKLDDAFTNCTFDKEIELMDPKRQKISTGSIVKVTILLRNPLFGIDIKTFDINWIFIVDKHPLLLEDLEYIDVSKVNCLELIKYEIDNISKKLMLLEERGNRCDLIIGKMILDALKLKQFNISQAIKMGGMTYIKEYLSQLITEASREFEKIQFHLKSDERNLAEIHNKRRMCITKEIEVWKKTRNMK